MKIKLNTWKIPGDHKCYHNDYIIVKQYYRDTKKAVKRKSMWNLEKKKKKIKSKENYVKEVIEQKFNQTDKFTDSVVGKGERYPT